MNFCTWILPLMPTSVQRSAILVKPVTGLLTTVRVQFVSSPKTGSPSLLAPPVHMGMLAAFKAGPQVPNNECPEQNKDLSLLPVSSPLSVCKVDFLCTFSAFWPDRNFSKLPDRP